VSGGGTAGHIYPALAVAEVLRAAGPDDVAFVGTPQGLEARLAGEAGVRFFGLPAKGFDRSKPLSLLVAVAVLAVSAVRAAGLLRRFRPDAVLGFGGYVSIPVGIAAVVCRVPLVLHEQNSVPGLANRLLARWSRVVAVTYESSAQRLPGAVRVVVTGNPVRAEVLASGRDRGREMLGVPGSATMLLVFGGSRGARHINEVLARHAGRLTDLRDIYVVHVAGREEADSVRERVGALGVGTGRYQVLEYIDEMGSALAAADLVIARAGATSIAEITALGRPAVLVPYPYATDDHQTTNARTVEEAGGALVVADTALDGPEFIEAVTDLLVDAGTRATMSAASKSLGHPDAAGRVASLVTEAAFERGRIDKEKT
ncbi:MAG: undecaprenyldiphospho-muramoylpentapeptide beta-N-acetylglucosaminyltransferase, partial [Coriobacteriia bacterium]|nr:undecaprenyldiphospho-muramoylpentapeptide beta-N-acetylglucosaminyltransferase [Coriobacteriia bacterium]